MTINSTELEALKDVVELLDSLELNKSETVILKNAKAAVKSLEKKRKRHNDTMARVMKEKRKSAVK